MTVEGWVEICAVALTVWAVLKTVRRPPARDWERLFQSTLSTVLRGRVEARAGTVEEWESLVLGHLLYNPSASEPDRLLVQPSVADIQTPARDGERALVERLERASSLEDRWKHLFVDDPRVHDALFADPAELGAAYDPAHTLGASVGWDDVAGWSSALQDLLCRRFSTVVFGVVDQPLLASALAENSVRVAEFSRDAIGAPSALLEPLEQTSDRLVLIAEGPCVKTLIAGLAQNPPLVDRLVGFVGIGADLVGDAEGSPLEHSFTHEALEPEVMRAIPYAFLTRIDPADPVARPWSDQRPRQPPEPTSGRKSIEVIDLGAVACPGVDDHALARALMVLLAVRLSE